MNSKYPFFKYVTGESKIHLMNSKMKIIWFLITLLAIILGVVLKINFSEWAICFLLLRFVITAELLNTAK